MDESYEYKYHKYKQKYINLCSSLFPQSGVVMSRSAETLSGGSPLYFENELHMYIIANITDKKIYDILERLSQTLAPNSKIDPHITLMELHINADDPHFIKHSKYLFSDSCASDSVRRATLRLSGGTSSPRKCDSEIAGKIKLMYEAFLSNVVYVEDHDRLYDYVGLSITKYFSKFYTIKSLEKIFSHEMILQKLFKAIAKKLGIFTDIVKSPEKSKTDGYNVFGYFEDKTFHDLFAITDFYVSQENIHPHITITSSEIIRSKNPQLYEHLGEPQQSTKLLTSLIMSNKRNISDIKKLRKIIPKHSIKQITLSPRFASNNSNTRRDHNIFHSKIIHIFK